MRKTLLALLLGAVLTVSSVSAADWIAFDKDELNVVLVNRSSIYKDNQMVSFWLTVVNIDPKLPYDTLAALSNIKCNARQWRLPYVEGFLRGKIVDGMKDGLEEWQYVIPGSLGEALWEIACTNTYEDVEPIAELSDVDYPGLLAEVLQPKMREARQSK